MERQPLIVSIKELKILVKELEKERQELLKEFGKSYPVGKTWQINIKRKTKFSNWELETK
jgi:hypothetical protein